MEESASCSMPDRPSHTQQGWAKGFRGPYGRSPSKPPCIRVPGLLIRQPETLGRERQELY